MSGGDSGIGLGGVISPEQDCNEIQIQVRLVSINEEELKFVNIGDSLNIIIKGSSVVAVNRNSSSTIGAIASADVVRLKRCIEKGYKYKGIVIEKDDESCVLVITSEEA